MSNIPLFIVAGTHFEIGYQIGQTYSALIRKYYDNHPWLERLEQYHETAEGRALVDAYWNVCTRRYPHYVEELKGMASGAEISMVRVQLLHLERELATKLEIYQKTLVDTALGCSDFLVNNKNERLIGHNEDWHSPLSGGDILLYATIHEYTGVDGQVFPREQFLVHAWPGVLPGGTFGLNSHGYVFSVDQLFPKVALEKKIPESFLLRRFLSCGSVSEVIKTARDEGQGASLGVSLNFGFVEDHELHNLETAPSSAQPRSKVDVYTLDAKKSFYAHFNNYKRIMDPSLVIPLCQERELVTTSLQTPCDVPTVMAALGDTSGTFPIYQDVEADLRWATLASVILDLQRREMLLFRKNPKTHDPIIRIPFSILPTVKSASLMGR